MIKYRYLQPITSEYYFHVPRSIPYLPSNYQTKSINSVLCTIHNYNYVGHIERIMNSSLFDGIIYHISSFLWIIRHFWGSYISVEITIRKKKIPNTRTPFASREKQLDGTVLGIRPQQPSSRVTALKLPLDNPATYQPCDEQPSNKPTTIH